MFIDYAELYFGGNGGPHMDYRIIRNCVDTRMVTYDSLSPIFLFMCHGHV